MPGMTYRSREHTVTAEEIEQFAQLTGDFTSLHLDDEVAARSSFGRRIAHGALIFSLSVGLKTQTLDTNESIIAFYGLDKLRFTAPTFIGDTIHIEKTVLAAPEVKVLGFIVSAKGVAADPAKVSAMKELPAPRSRKELRQFVGSLNYYRRKIFEI